jgi:spore maturation protein CgeB
MTLNIVVFGLSITSSWGNGHATTYRALIKALERRGHRVVFLERDVPWYRDHRDLAEPPYCRTELYQSLAEVPARFARIVADADLVIVGSYVPDGVAISDWVTTNANGVTAFYDIDTPVTLEGLERGGTEYLAASLVPRFDLYLSFTGGPTLRLIEERYGSPRARALYCSVDPEIHRPLEVEKKWALGYLGTYSPDRQPALERLLVEPAKRLPERRFVVVGAQYPDGLDWPGNVERVAHLPPSAHAEFYCAQEFTLNVTRAAMVAAGHSPSVRLFEAAACAVPIISDRWPGIETIFEPGREIFICDTAEEAVAVLGQTTREERLAVAEAARRRVLACHTADCRAAELESYVGEVSRSNVLEVAARRTKAGRAMA